MPLYAPIFPKTQGWGPHNVVQYCGKHGCSSTSYTHAQLNTVASCRVIWPQNLYLDRSLGYVLFDCVVCQAFWRLRLFVPHGSLDASQGTHAKPAYSHLWRTSVLVTNQPSEGETEKISRTKRRWSIASAFPLPSGIAALDLVTNSLQ